ncbi:MAG: hypothetical protein AAGD92_01935 [Pseudomonadota bacterium]
MMRIVLTAAAMAAVSACASLSPRAEIEDQFVSLGISRDRAECLADDLDERLDRDELVDVSNFVGSLNAADSAGGALDALLGIDNPRIAGAIARASVACAFSRN